LSRPFVKAVGGKTKLVSTILGHVPTFLGHYHEPFVGGGAVFLALQEKLHPLSSGSPGTWATLNDANAELMNAYAVVKARAGDLVRRLQLMAKNHSKETYYQIRSKEEAEPLARAARFVYLNKTCFNGLYRVNGDGKFNVPIGSYKNPTIVEPEIMGTWYEALKDVKLFSEDFLCRLAEIKKGDFVYADPPYLPRSKTANFTSYTADKFGEKDHEHLANALVNVHKRGAKFLCSQGDSDAIRQLYKQFTIVPVEVLHMVGAAAKSRTTVKELLIKNY
jgi:DNA adenine methylase